MATPLYDRLTPEVVKAFHQFDELTTPVSPSPNLSYLTDLAEKIANNLDRANPYTQQDPRDSWYFQKISNVKSLLDRAITHKKEYYENTRMGRITKFILKLFCFWYRDTSPAIRKAEDFLLRYDSRYVSFSSERGPFQLRVLNLESPLPHFFNYEFPYPVKIV